MLSIIDQKVFIRRSKDSYFNQKKRALGMGRALNFSLEEFRTVVTKAMGEACPYCGFSITVENFSADHKEPISRGGSFSLPNIIISCLLCNLAKGPIEYLEWRELMNVVRQWPAEVKANFFARLRAGGMKVKSIAKRS